MWRLIDLVPRHMVSGLGLTLLGAAGNHAIYAMGSETSQPAAQRQEQDTLEEIVVSAQRRSQSVQDVAISMEAYGGKDMEALGLNTMEDIARVAPNLSFVSFYAAGKPSLSIRGIGIGGLFTNFEQSPVGVYNDDVFIGSRSGQLAQMFDLERVEVLRGPQGTLFGRNTTAGAINFIARKPGDHFEANAEVEYGRWNERNLSGALTVPMSDTFAVRVAGIYRMRDGWVFNTNPTPGFLGRRMNNIDNWAARLVAQWKPTTSMTWTLNLHGNGNDTVTPVIHADLGQDGTCQPNIYTGYQPSCKWNEAASSNPVFEVLNARGGSLTGTINVGELTVTSITGYERVNYSEAEDDAGGPLSIATMTTKDTHEEVSQELRIAGKHGSFDWVGGVYYFTDSLRQTLRATAFLDPAFVGGPFAAYAADQYNTPKQTSHNQAVFGDVRYAFLDGWTLDLGARYTRETKSIHGMAFANFPGFDTGWFQTIGGPGQPNSYITNTWSAPTGRVAVEWKPGTDVMTYLSWSHGFKSGGYNGMAMNDVSELGPYDQERGNTFELGAKTTWLDGKLSANAALFLNKIRNLQVLDTVVQGGIAFFYVRNAANGTSKGAEFELRAQPTERWYASLGVGLLNTKYDKYILPAGTDYTGEEFINSPKFSADAAIQYSIPMFGGVLAPLVNLSYKTHVWTHDAHRPGLDEIAGYGLIDATIPWTSGSKSWEFAIWGRNLGNKRYYLQTVGNYATVSGAAVSYHATPRTYGVRVSYAFK